MSVYHQRISHIQSHFSLGHEVSAMSTPIPADITYLLTRSDSRPGLRLRGMRGKLRLLRGWGAMRTVSSLPWWASWVLRGHIHRPDILLLISCAYLDYLKINERFQIWWIVLGFMSRRAEDIKLCQDKSFPRTIKQWTSKQRMTVSY